MSIDCENLLRPLCVGSLTLKNRAVVAAMTRIRADDDHTPNDLMREYFAERAGYGLIVTDPTMVQRNYSAFGYEPGIFNHRQVEAWRCITEAVHEKGGAIFLHLSHGGRVTTPSCLTSPNLLVMGPSRNGVPTGCSETRSAMMDREGRAQPFPPKVHKMQLSEIAFVQDCFVRAANNAMAAGFDGVEIDAANGYLIDQFLRDGCNDRTDAYGGSVENRARFLLDVVDGIAAAIGKERVGVRLSPLSTYNGMSDSDPDGLLAYVAEQLEERHVSFMELVCTGAEGRSDASAVARLSQCVRAHFHGPILCNGGFTPESAERAIADGTTDGVSFGTLAVANPDLVERLTVGAALNEVQWSTINGRGAAGYTDYPTLQGGSKKDRRTGDAVPHDQASSSPVSPTAAAAAAGGRPVGSQTPADRLLRPLVLHSLTLNNRMIMAPLPRQRADAAHVPTDAMVKYYADRSSMGLIVSEPVEIQPGYHTYVQGPCLFTKAQVDGWRKVTDAVHAKGGLIYCQLHHGGRAVAACNLERYDYGAENKDGGERSLKLQDGPEDEPADAKGVPSSLHAVNVISASTRPVPKSVVCPAAFSRSGKEEPYPQTIVAVRRAKIAWLVKMYASAARKAMAAGFDGVEIQASNGYLIDQFLRDGCNDRTDAYGGNVENRCRLLLEVVDAVVSAIGKERVGVRVSPTDPALGMRDSNVPELCRTLARVLDERDVAYLAITCDYAMHAFHCMRPIFHRRAIFVDAPASTHATFGDCEDLLDDEKHRAQQANMQSLCTDEYGDLYALPEFADLAPPPNDHFAPDAVSFLLPMVANPDLADKAVHGVPFKRENGALLFTHGEEGYNDYPTFKEERWQARRAAREARERGDAVATTATTAAATPSLSSSSREVSRPRQGRSTDIADAENANEASDVAVNQPSSADKPATITRIARPTAVSPARRRDSASIE